MPNIEPSVEEKIDYIYSRMRRQEKLETFASILKWGTRLLVVISIVYFFFVKLPALKEDIIDSLTPDIPTISTESITNNQILNQIKDRFFSEEEDGEIQTEKQPETNNYY